MTTWMLMFTRLLVFFALGGCSRRDTGGAGLLPISSKQESFVHVSVRTPLPRQQKFACSRLLDT